MSNVTQKQLRRARQKVLLVCLQQWISKGTLQAPGSHARLLLLTLAQPPSIFYFRSFLNWKRFLSIWLILSGFLFNELAHSYLKPMDFYHPAHSLAPQAKQPTEAENTSVMLDQPYLHRTRLSGLRQDRKALLQRAKRSMRKRPIKLMSARSWEYFFSLKKRNFL